MSSKTNKINFSISALVHSTGEVEMDDASDDRLFIRAVTIHPIITIFSTEMLTDEEKGRIQTMALHQLMRLAHAESIPVGMELNDTIEIPINSNEGERN
jgi:hypothetical protein